MTETPKMGPKLKNLIVSSFLSKSLPPGGQEKVKRLGGKSAPWVLKGPKSAGLNRVKNKRTFNLFCDIFESM